MVRLKQNPKTSSLVTQNKKKTNKKSAKKQMKKYVPTASDLKFEKDYQEYIQKIQALNIKDTTTKDATEDYLGDRDLDVDNHRNPGECGHHDVLNELGEVLLSWNIASFRILLEGEYWFGQTVVTTFAASVRANFPCLEYAPDIFENRDMGDFQALMEYQDFQQQRRLHFVNLNKICRLLFTGPKDQGHYSIMVAFKNLKTVYLIEHGFENDASKEQVDMINFILNSYGWGNKSEIKVHFPKKKDKKKILIKSGQAIFFK